MRNFLKIASGIETLGVLMDLARQPELWNRHTDRTRGDSPHREVDDIWLRFRAYGDLTTPESFAEPFVPSFYPAWTALAHQRPIVFGLMARCEAVQLGGVLITRVGPGRQVARHNDKNRWHPEFFTTKIYVPLTTNPDCINTCDDEKVTMMQGDAWIFDNLKMHSTENNGDTDRITLIISLRVE
jgi:hypothetical protein